MIVAENNLEGLYFVVKSLENKTPTKIKEIQIKCLDSKVVVLVRGEGLTWYQTELCYISTYDGCMMSQKKPPSGNDTNRRDG